MDKDIKADLENIKASVREGSEKLQKVLADAGLGSRRGMEALIEDGRVRVNGKIAGLGLRVLPEDSITVDGKPVDRPTLRERAPRVLLYNKPMGEIVSMSDPEGRPTVFDNLPEIQGSRWIAVGRLDFNTEGLLIFTTSGELANLLMHPRYSIEREYLARVSGELTEETGQALVDGIELEDGPARFLHISDHGGTGVNHWYLVRLAEGRNREVRRMFEAVGLIVNRLVRVKFGDIDLPRSLRRGEKVEMDPEWVQRWISSLKETQGRAKAGEFTRGHGTRGKASASTARAPGRRPAGRGSSRTSSGSRFGRGGQGSRR